MSRVKLKQDEQEMAGRRGLLSLTALATILIVMGDGVSGEKKLSHPAFTKDTSMNMKVLYWLVIHMYNNHVHVHCMYPCRLTYNR